MIKKGSLYSASDKALFDALCQNKMTKQSLQELFWTRGIIKPNKLDKESIAKYFSRLNHDYYDHKFISEKISSGTLRERQKSSFTQTKFDISNLEASVRELVKERKDIDNSIDFNTHEKSINIEVSYSYYDYKKPEFKQVVSKTATITIEQTADGISIRAPDNSYVDEITKLLTSKIKSSSTEEIEIETINLIGIDNVEVKIEFFEKLISGLDGLELCDVSDVAVYNPETGADSEIGVHVKKASLNGEGILKSGELKQFHKKGFFSYKISWSMKEKGNSTSDIYNFQAQFNDPETCKNFAYLAKGYRKNLGKGEYAKEISPLSPFDETRMMRKLENSARSAKRSVFNPTKEVNNENKN